MKKIVSLILISIGTCIYAQTNFPQHVWHITLHVIDEAGIPIMGANAGVGYFTNTVGTSADGLTDGDGNFSASYHNAFGGSFGLVAEKSGYYTIRRTYFIPPTYDFVKWNPDITLVLKKIGKPVSMYAKSVNLGLPEIEKPVGYDFEMGDWVAPYGKGITADILFTGHLIDPPSRSHYTLTVSFPNKDDGIQVYVPTEGERGSALRSPHEAPLDGYQEKLTRENSSHKFEYDEHRVYLFRVRSKVDDRGNLVSAHYGKIYGDFMQFIYYFNPTPNDRNIEFNPTENLIKINTGRWSMDIPVKAP